MALKRKQLDALEMIGLAGEATATAESSGLFGETAYIHWKTAEALERAGLITIRREIDGDGRKAWDLLLTREGRIAWPPPRPLLL